MENDPREIGDRCLFGWSGHAYTILEFDGVDWIVVWDGGRYGTLSRYWNPAIGDRILSRPPRPRYCRAADQLQLFPEAA